MSDFLGGCRVQEGGEATGCKKLIMTALWTEASLAFPSLNAQKKGYKVYVVADAVGWICESVAAVNKRQPVSHRSLRSA